MHRAQLKPIVGEHARAVHGLVGTDGFAQECSLLDAKGAPPSPRRPPVARWACTAEAVAAGAERTYMQSILVATAAAAP